MFCLSIKKAKWIPWTDFLKVEARSFYTWNKKCHKVFQDILLMIRLFSGDNFQKHGCDLGQMKGLSGKLIIQHIKWSLNFEILISKCVVFDIISKSYNINATFRLLAVYVSFKSVCLLQFHTESTIWNSSIFWNVSFSNSVSHQ